MNLSRMRLPVLTAAVAGLITSAAARIELKPEGHFEAPGFAFLVYHNDYLMGKRGGLEVFLHGRRIIDAGQVVAMSRAGTPSSRFPRSDATRTNGSGPSWMPRRRCLTSSSTTRTSSRKRTCSPR